MNLPQWMLSKFLCFKNRINTKQQRTFSSEKNRKTAGKNTSSSHFQVQADMMHKTTVLFKVLIVYTLVTQT